MNEKAEHLRRLLSRRGIPVAAIRDLLLAEFASQPAITEICQRIDELEEKVIRDWEEKLRIADLAAAPVALANGMVGREYSAEIRWGALDAYLGEHHSLNQIIPGLHYDPLARRLTGTPSEAGEFDLILEFSIAGSTTGQRGTKSVKVIINHDPKSLWKNAPSDCHDRYWQEDEASSGVRFGKHLVLAASKRGRSHAHEGKFRDDSFRIEYFDDHDWGIVAVSDGAGSSKYSRKGAALACEAVASHFRSFSSEQWATLDRTVEAYLSERSDTNRASLNEILPVLMISAARDACDAIYHEARSASAEVRDYSCTLLFALSKQFSSHFTVVSFWVGDGGIGLYQESSGEIHLLGEPDSGEYAGETRFLTTPDVLSGQRVRFKAVENFTALVLMTDGVSDPKFQTDANLKSPPVWKDLWNEIGEFGANAKENQPPWEPEEGKTALLEWLDFWSPGNHDDRTIAIIYPGAQS